MHVLTLFSGTHSVGKALQEIGWGEESLDWVHEATYQLDVNDWDYKAFTPGHFDIIWASPDCSQFSKARWNLQNRAPRDFGTADTCVLKTIEIIEYLKPKYWFIENPETGLLKQRHYMHSRPYSVVDYCMYGFNFRKRTAIWSNICPELDTVLMRCNKQCGAFIDGKHIATINGSFCGPRRGMIPHQLLLDIFSKVQQLEDGGGEIQMHVQQTVLPRRRSASH
jgi:site-specific DNA-cytosine methylase